MEKDPARADYPFVNCTNCGPRFTIIEGLPYDRPRTTMKDFEMCGSCREEYNDVLDRRFHAQPIACNSCGPVYRYRDKNKSLDNIKEIIGEIGLQIAGGKTVAIKGLGGYHLMCDALNEVAVAGLRLKKHRDNKPFAIMFRDITAVRKYCFADEAEEKELQSWRRPILILEQREGLSHSAGSGLNTVGAMLPYMPMHYLIFRYLETPAVVLTSGNISDEPVIIDDDAAERQLMNVADSLVSYNRQIYNRTDDSVLRFIDNSKCLYRRSRGYVPQPVDLELNAEGILALGAEQKNSICFGKGFQAVMSQYIGDLKNPAAYDFFTDTVERLSGLLHFSPEIICCDLHPDYLSSQYAEVLKNEINKPVFRIQHHHAHIASCMAENGIDEPVIGISMDGTGYGPDENIWGGEFMIASLKDYKRITHFDYVPMPGGEKAASEPWRMALSYIYKCFGENFDYQSFPLFRSVDRLKFSLVMEMMVSKINSPLTSSAGRLFDAIAAILGLCSQATFDSEAPMRLESVADRGTRGVYPFTSGRTVDFSETLRAIIRDLPLQSIPVISAKFHNTVAQVISEVSCRIRSETSIRNVVLSGGVFQNKYLAERSSELLRRNGFMIFVNHMVPPNDGGISLGQLIITSKIRKECV